MHKEDIIIVNVYTPNFIKQTLLDIKESMYPNIIIVNDFNTSLSGTDSRSKQNKSTKKFYNEAMV
jgi:hypothetical protein